MTMDAARVLLSRLFRSTSSRSKDADISDRDTGRGSGDVSPQWGAPSKRVDPGQDQNGANKLAVQASGDAINKGAPDGVSASPSESEGANIQGRSAGGESGGGAYPNPKSGKAGTNSGFMGMVGRPTSRTMVASRPEITAVQRQMLRPAARMIMRDPNAPDEPPLTRPSC